jgi:hypothetical protein
VDERPYDRRGVQEGDMMYDYKDSMDAYEDRDHKRTMDKLDKLVEIAKAIAPNVYQTQDFKISTHVDRYGAIEFEVTVNRKPIT